MVRGGSRCIEANGSRELEFLREVIDTTRTLLKDWNDFEEKFDELFEILQALSHSQDMDGRLLELFGAWGREMAIELAEEKRLEKLKNPSLMKRTLRRLGLMGGSTNTSTRHDSKS